MHAASRSGITPGMRVLFVAPYPLDVPGGNSTALQRLVRCLEERCAAEGEPFDALVTT